MSPGEISTLTLLVLSPLIAWRIYARIRRMIGRQRISRIRPWVTLIVFPLLLALLALLVYTLQPQRLVWLALGLAVGAAVAVDAVRRTRFEVTSEGLFYTPPTRLGIAISLLFVGRIGYRLVQLVVHGPPPPGQPDPFTTSPATLAVIGLLAGYYMAYAIGLLLWQARQRRIRM